ncbi:MAG: exodeoxyribonuclease V subunit gamma, partial [Clostridiales Family XIII bacterium]|nr:exodeoxyribonuclease V subunit gamma [Clostridiales Family XIII bacterium]
MLNIYCGREDIDKEAFLFSLVGQGIGTLREAGDADGRILLIVPDQFTLEAERGAFHYLGHEGFMELEIISLSRLRQRVFGEAGEDGRVPIGRNGRHMLLSAIIRQRIEELESFTGAQGVKALAEMMNDLISEMKLHNISPDDVRGLCEGEGQPVLKRKLADISMIYSSYEALTHGKYMDSEEHLMCFMAKLPKSRLVRDSIVWMYGFDYFSPKDIDIIKALASCARGLNIMLTSVPPAGARAGSGAASSGGREAGAVALSAGGRREGEQAEAAAPSAGARRVGVQAGAGASSAGARAEAAPFYRDGDVFRITQRLIASLRASAGESGIRCEVHDICALGAELRARPPALSHIERELFSYPYSVYRGEAPELTLLSAANYYAEAESAAAEITRLIRDCGCRYRDIAVICNDLEKRGAVIKRVFSEYGLPVFMDKRKNLLHNPVLEYIAALMDIAAGNWRTEDVLRLMKTGMSPLDPAQCELLDEYAVRYRIRGKGGWTREFERLSPYEIPATQAEGGPGGRLERLNAARGAIVSHIMKFIDVISGLRSVEGRTRALYLFLRDEARLPEKLECQAGTFREAGHAERADELSQVWAQIVEIFDQMVAVLGDAKLSREDYSGLLAAGLENIEIGMIPTTNDQILIGTMQRTRTGRVDTLFVLGANDGVLPASGSGDGLLNDDERARIFRGGKMVGKLDALRAEEEQLAIYRNLSRVDRRLWMSYSASDPDGGELRPSLIFEKLRKMFPENGVRKDLRSSGEALELIGAKEGALVHLTAALREMADRAGPVAKAAAADAVAQAPQGQARQVAERPAPAGPEGAQAPPGRAGQAAEGVTPLGAPLADAVWLNALGWFRQNAPEKLKPIEAGILFTNRRERIGREYVKRLYGYGANAAAPGANTAEPRANAAEPGTGAAPDGVPHEGAGAVAASDAGMPEAAGTIAAPDGVPREGAGAVAASDAGMPEAAATVIRLSPSGLERYARCPFAHFVAYGLRPA